MDIQKQSDYLAGDVSAVWNERHREWNQNPHPEIFEGKHVWFNERFSHILPVFPPDVEGIRHGRVLDFGCGCGMYSRPLLERFQIYYGRDSSGEAIKTARNYFFDLRATFQEQPPNTVSLEPFEDGFFDCAVSITVLQHLPIEMRLEAIREISRVLKPGGIYIGLERQDGDAPDMPKMGNDAWRSAWRKAGMLIVFDAPPEHPEWRNDNVWVGFKWNYDWRSAL